MKNVLFILFFPLLVHSQSKPLIIEGVSSNLYLTHTTGPKESFYSIGRIYNISPKIMAPYNKLVLEKGLIIGQVVKIPLNETNFSQDGIATPDESLVPLYHKVKPKETLYNISITNNKVPVEVLKKWNNLSTDAVPNGSNMIVGFLKVKKDLSPLVNAAIITEPVSTSVTSENKEATSEKPTVKKSEPIKTEPVKTEPAKTETAKTETVKTETPKSEPVKTETPKSEPVKTEPAKTETAKTEPAKTETVKTETPKSEPVKTEPAKTETAKTEPAKTETVKTEPAKSQPVTIPPVKTEPIVIKKTTAETGSSSGTPDFNGGFFKSTFQKQTVNKEERGQAGTFKSTSGWQDGKYYCLHNTARAGTIMMITNPVNQRTVYAKVLDVIPDINQNEGMIIRLSNAAADELGVATDNFDCTLNF